MTVYRIKDWNVHFENNRTRQMDDLRWVPVPNKHDGEGYRTIMAEKDGIEIYGCWHLILQVASKCHPRGVLVRGDGTPHTPTSLSIKTGWMRSKDFERALAFCSSSQVGWIEQLTNGCAGKRHPSDANVTPDCVEGKGIEGNRIEGKEENSMSRWQAMLDKYRALGVDVDREKTKAEAWLLTPKAKGRKMTQQFFANWLARSAQNDAPVPSNRTKVAPAESYAERHAQLHAQENG